MTGSGQASTADGTVAQSYTAVGMESVTVPAGTFEAMKIEATINFDMQVVLEGGITAPFAFEMQSTNWWAPGVGWVKAVSDLSSEGGDVSDSVSELVSFTIP